MAVRAATADDYPAFVELFDALETGDDTTPQPEWEQRLMPQTLVYEDEGRTLAYVLFQVLADLGYIRHLAVDAAHRGRGIGRTLMSAVGARLREAGIETWCLNVKPDNVPAIALYEKLGMRQQYTTHVVRMHWDVPARLPPADADVDLLEPSDDAAVEAALGMPGGLIAKQRGPGCELLVARRDGHPMGLAAFRPSFPGAYPFRAADLGTTRTLLDAMYPRRDETKEIVQVVLEDAEPIARALVDAGGWPHLEIVHLKGPVPTP